MSSRRGCYVDTERPFLGKERGRKTTDGEVREPKGKRKGADYIIDLRMSRAL